MFIASIIKTSGGQLKPNVSNKVVTTNRVLVEKLYLIKDVTFSVNVGNAVVAPVLKAIVKYSVHPSIKKINK